MFVPLLMTIARLSAVKLLNLDSFLTRFVTVESKEKLPTFCVQLRHPGILLILLAI